LLAAQTRQPSAANVSAMLRPIPRPAPVTRAVLPVNRLPMGTPINVDNYKEYPTEVFINQKGNLTKPFFVQADNLPSVSKKRLKKFPASLDLETMLEIAQKVVLALELENAMPDG
jgi:mRNA-degrading endonuclease toxin of MazEF toxin-antitoxin module